MSQPFNHVETGLDPGLMLIEASAGTGKTYALAGLVLRLLLEEGFSIRQVLVVTFTDAAAGELRDRVRRRLVEAMAAFKAGESKDKLLQALLTKETINRAEAQRQLWRALLDFDEAPIHTIHAFCQRVLEEQAFETRQAYGVELLTDSGPLLQAVARDWWRCRLYSLPQIHALAALAADIEVEELARKLEEVLKRPGVKVETGTTSGSLAASADNLSQAFKNLQEKWNKDRKTIERPFQKGFNEWANAPYSKPEIMHRVFRGIEALLKGQAVGKEVVDHLRLLTPEALAKGTKKKNPAPPPAHPFYGKCQDLVAACQDYSAWLWLDFLQSAAERVAHLLKTRNSRTYQAQLSQLADVLRDEAGERLAAALAQRYPVALIDEFQDTDPLQFEIFNTVFNRPNCRLWMVGDPKQAIYAFRGADVFTYLLARQAVPQNRVFTLPVNRRSDSRLVAAVNSLFDWQPSFVIPGIDYEQVQAFGDVDRRPLREGGRQTPPLRLWLWEGIKGNDSDEKNWARLAPAVSREVRRLLDEQVTIGMGEGARRMQASDIAVLVERHQDGDKVEAALRDAGVATSRQSKASVFETDEAGELYLLLQAIANPADEFRFRAALTTRFLGLDTGQIHALANDEDRWRKWLEEFHEHRLSWAKSGFDRMFQKVLLDYDIPRRLLGLPDGPRRITNLLHLAALLGAAADQQHLQARGLLRWFADRRDEEETAPEEHTLRVERDDNAVRILTAHASKGLQYPVVFCPYLQKPAQPSKKAERFENILFHEDDATPQVTLDLAKNSAENKARSRRETLAGAVRLLYVALTRAEHRCYLAWGRRAEQRSGGPAWLFLRPQNAGPDTAGDLDQTVERTDLNAVQAQLQGLAGARAGCIQVESLPPEPETPLAPTQPTAPPLIEALVFARCFDRSWGISSFTSLAKGGQRTAADHADPAAAQDPLAEPAPDPLKDFGAGARLGECVHETLEVWLGAGRGQQELEAVAARKLAKFGFGGNAQPAALAAVLQRALDLDLPRPGVAHGSALRLVDLPAHDRLAEVKFHFPLRSLTTKALARCFQGDTAPQALAALADGLGSLKFSPREGFLTGSIDLVCCWEGRFFMVDWKTNRLADYEVDGVQAAMLEHHYGLQYHLYVLALDRFLAARVKGYSYERDFGGVFYLFLRGLDPARPGAGVFHDRPDPALMERLRATLLPSLETAP
jgi:exodeoxyribonuclease V beta subunit